MVLRPGPFVFPLEPVNIVSCVVSTVFDAAVLAINGLGGSQEAIVDLILEEQSDVLMQARLIVFDLDDIIGVLPGGYPMLRH